MQPLSAQPTVYLSDTFNREIASYSGGSATDEVVVQGIGAVRRLVVDAEAGQMYWTEATDTEARIMRADLDGSNIEILFTEEDGLVFPYGLAIDPVGGKLYWADGGRKDDAATSANEETPGRIRRGDLDGKGPPETLVTLDDNVETSCPKHGRPNGIALDLKNRRVYWTESTSEEDTGSIQRADLDADHPNPECLQSGLDTPWGIALDMQEDKVYWAEQGTKTVWGANLNVDETSTRAVVERSSTVLSVALDVETGALYWTEADAEFSEAGGIVTSDFALQKADLDGRNVKELTAGTGFVDGVALDVPMVVPGGIRTFDAVVEGTDIVVTWTAMSEPDSTGFEIEWTQGGSAFEQIAVVESHGNSTANKMQQYSHRITGVSPGTYTLRLRQVDADGTPLYSPEVEVQVGGEAAYTLSAPYPNPFATEAAVELTVRDPQHVTVAVYNTLGQHVRTLFEGTADAYAPQTFRLEAQGLSSGTYLYRVVGETFTETRTVTLVK